MNTRRKPSKTGSEKSETSLQYRVAGYLNKLLAPPAFFMSYPADEPNKIKRMINASMGVKAGVPDIGIFSPTWLFDQLVGEWQWGCKVYGIELKKKNKGKLSDAQIRVHPKLMAAGWTAIAICEDLDQVKAALAYWQIPTLTESVNEKNLREAVEKHVLAVAK